MAGWNEELSVNILILNQGGPMNNVIPLPEDPWGGGCMVSPPGPRSITAVKENTCENADDGRTYKIIFAMNVMNLCC